MGNDPEVMEKVRQLNMIDDIMFQKMAEDEAFCSEMISTILEEQVTVIKTIPQSSIKNLQGRSVILDALCSTKDQKLVNVEIQKANDDNHVKRVRYNSSCITANVTDPGQRFEKVPDVYTIFVSKFDIFRGGKTVYHIERIIRETGERSENGLKEIYVNTRIDDGSDIAKLMHLFTEHDTYDFERFPRSSSRKKQFKMTKEGEDEMCEIVEEYANKKAEQERNNTIKRMLGRGYAIEEILEIYPELDQQILEKIKNQSEREIKS